MQGFDKPDRGADMAGAGAVEYRPEEDVPGDRLAAIRARHEARLLGIAGVTMVGIGQGPVGEPAISVGVTDSSVLRRLPSRLDDVPVVGSVTGPVDALGARR